MKEHYSEEKQKKHGISGDIPLLPVYAFMAWTGKKFTF
jgi:hypothetical protein